ncbi:hypothetical protein D9757_001355 [Collybiopsis confluens]|uniref:Hyaluronan/mRNA-binding protein domain-containing protein n=1 Tax=Collybiopsis confluens TaxID=2823264 RepID=A0A8H5I0T2_9AGAR|nr:hypothetical protein D9757_001355 [Collybiopsis confluens]
MTRTSRAAFPRAILKDRQSRSGLSNEMKKGGAGTHNWGKLGEMETDQGDVEPEYDSEGETAAMNEMKKNAASLMIAEASEQLAATGKRSTSVPNAKETEEAMQLRKHALNGQVDLAAIARSSVVLSSSPPKSVTGVNVNTK